MTYPDWVFQNGKWNSCECGMVNREPGTFNGGMEGLRLPINSLPSHSSNKSKRDDMGRFISTWFRHLRTDWFSLASPSLKTLPFVLRTPSHGRMIITATNAMAEL